MLLAALYPNAEVIMVDSNRKMDMQHCDDSALMANCTFHRCDVNGAAASTSLLTFSRALLSSTPTPHTPYATLSLVPIAPLGAHCSTWRPLLHLVHDPSMLAGCWC